MHFKTFQLKKFQIRHFPEVEKLLSFCKNDGLIIEADGKYCTGERNDKLKDHSVPFIVVEGLDASGKSSNSLPSENFIFENLLYVVVGKTSIAAKVQERFGMRALQTPPRSISHFRDFFDNQSETVRRAFYSLGNYLAANEVSKCTEPVIMDR